MHIEIVRTDVTAVGANGAAGPGVIVPAIDELATGKEAVDARHDLPIESEGLPATGHDGEGAEDRPHGIAALNGVGPDGAPLTGVRRLRWIMADPVAREALRRRYEETRETQIAIAKDIGVSDTCLSRYAKEAGWTRPPRLQTRSEAGAEAIERSLATTIADAGAVTARLLRSVDRQIRKIDGRLMKRGSEIEEKDSRILGHLARTLATLMALDRDGGATAKEPERVDRDELNADLARRIARWAEGREEPA